MGLFDLGDYWRKKVRADKSARAPRRFPVAFADVLFDGRMQKLRFEPMLLNGGAAHISFRPDDAPSEHALICGGGEAPWRITECFRDDETSGEPHALMVWSERAFDVDEWLTTAVSAVKNGQFGRLIVEEKDGMFVDHFFSSAGNWDQDYHISSTDGSLGFIYAPTYIDFDWSDERNYWATKETAAELLIRLNAAEFALHLEGEKAKPSSVYGLSCRWPELSHEERLACLPPWEQEHGRHITSLMRAIVWSDAAVGRGEPALDLQRHQFFSGYGSETPFWRRAFME